MGCQEGEGTGKRFLCLPCQRPLEVEPDDPRGLAIEDLAEVPFVRPEHLHDLARAVPQDDADLREVRLVAAATVAVESSADEVLRQLDLLFTPRSAPSHLESSFV